MNRNEFDDLAVRALRRLDEPNERAWAAAKPKKRDWLPSWQEIGFATAVGGVTLLCLASVGNRQAETTEPTLARAETKGPNRPFDSSFVSINRLAGVPASLMKPRARG